MLSGSINSHDKPVNQLLEKYFLIKSSQFYCLHFKLTKLINLSDFLIFQMFFICLKIENNAYKIR